LYRAVVLPEGPKRIVIYWLWLGPLSVDEKRVA
jgi:hypothetical protein